MAAATISASYRCRWWRALKWSASPLIHLVPGEPAAGSDVPQPLHQGFDSLRAPRLRYKLLQPFAEGHIQEFALGAGHLPGLLD